MSLLLACERQTKLGVEVRFLAKRFLIAWRDGSQTLVHIRAIEFFKTETLEFSPRISDSVCLGYDLDLHV